MRLARQRARSKNRGPTRPRLGFRRLGFEPLEARRLLAVFSVNSTDDNVNGSDSVMTLREAIMGANSISGADEIQFDPMVFGANPRTIELSHLGELTITRDLTIRGPGADKLTIRGFNPSTEPGDGSRIFTIDDGNLESMISVELSGLTLSGGDANDDGGAIRSLDRLSVVDVVIEDNESRGNGGGIVNMQGELTVTRSTIRGNVSRSGGGGILSVGDLTIISSTINGNTAALDGGGFSAREGDFRIVNSTLSGNEAGTFGGGAVFSLFASGRTAQIEHSTITANRANASRVASGFGGGVFAFGPGSLDIDHTIVAGNTDRLEKSPDVSILLGTQLELSYSLIGNNRGSGLAAAPVADEAGNLIGSDASPIDPLLGPLANNDGPTQTHAVLPGSPAMNAGRPTATPGEAGVPEFDQRGSSRIVGSRLDMGAYEFKPAPDDNEEEEEEEVEEEAFPFVTVDETVETQTPNVETDAPDPVLEPISLLNFIEPPLPAEFPDSDGGAGGGFPEPDELDEPIGAIPIARERAQLAVYNQPSAMHDESLVDAVFSLGELEMVSLIGWDMGDEPVFKAPTRVAKKPIDDIAPGTNRGPLGAIAPLPVAEVPTAPGWKSLALWAALAGSCTLWISGTWWWMHRGRKNPP